MDPSQVATGADFTRESHVTVAIPLSGGPVKYEVDKIPAQCTWTAFSIPPGTTPVATVTYHTPAGDGAR